MRISRSLPFFLAYHGALSKNYKEQFMKEAQSRLAEFPDEYGYKRSDDGIDVYMSKEDKICGGELVPMFASVMEIQGADPVAVFNIMADQLKQPKWGACNNCLIEWLKNDCDQQVRGLYSVFPAQPMMSRSYFSWEWAEQLQDGTEFLVGVSNQHVKALKAIRDPIASTYAGDMCYAFSHISATPDGVRLVQMSHVNIHAVVGLRAIYSLVWGKHVARAKRVRDRALSPSMSKINRIDSSAAPLWMLEKPIDGSCDVVVEEDGRNETVNGSANVSGKLMARVAAKDFNVPELVLGMTPFLFWSLISTLTLCLCIVMAGLLCSGIGFPKTGVTPSESRDEVESEALTSEASDARSLHACSLLRRDS